MKKSNMMNSLGFCKETVSSFEPKTKLTVGLSRYSAGGSCYVLCDGARSTFRSYTPEEKGKLNSNLQIQQTIPMEDGATYPRTGTNIPI